MRSFTMILTTASIAAAVAVPAQAVQDLPPATSSHESPPPAPNPLGATELNVVSQAGIGGKVAYARSGVVELGGGLSWRSGSDAARLTLSPQVGYFLTNNFELSGLVHLETKGTRSEKVTALIEPSVHLPLMETLFGFVGLGLGASYQDRLVGVALAPRVGANVMVGRSGILTPSFGGTLATQRKASDPTLLAASWQFNLNVGYSVMW